MKCKNCLDSINRKEESDYVWSLKKYCGKQCKNIAAGKRNNWKHYTKVGRAWKSGPEHQSWKGGRFVGKGGTIYVWNKTHPSANKNNYVAEHRLVMEKAAGRFLRPEEVVHHLDFDHQNNKISNLHLFENQSKHARYHSFLKSCVREVLL